MGRGTLAACGLGTVGLNSRANQMTHRGKFIAIEGIDGSGKRTQIDLLSSALEARGIDHVRYSFPRYESSFGRLVARYLNGEFGRLDTVDAHFSALLYAGDRFEAKGELAAALASGRTVLADRYVGSNLAHQTARVGPQRREEFLSWLKRLEYGIYGLPVEDLVIYLRLPAVEAHRLVGLKTSREYTSLQRDLQEADLKHLEQAALVYDRLATEPNWVTVECFDSTAGALLPPEVIHRAVMAAVEAQLVGQARAT
ncbi:MAG: thymidylate kinase [Acidobacteria bacterium]|nr:MAG: thymidylate kinase [Acidobacteriota bacterium]